MGSLRYPVLWKSDISCPAPSLTIGKISFNNPKIMLFNFSFDEAVTLCFCE